MIWSRVLISSYQSWIPVKNVILGGYTGHDFLVDADGLEQAAANKAVNLIITHLLKPSQI